MSKLPMYIVMTLTMGIGGYLPVMFGAGLSDASTIVGTVIGGIIGIIILQKLRSYGYLE